MQAASKSPFVVSRTATLVKLLSLSVLFHGTNAEKTHPPNQKANTKAMARVNIVPSINRVTLDLHGLINTAAKMVRKSEPATIAKTIHPNHPIWPTWLIIPAALLLSPSR
jgi:heme/copper-type cytochrome/quinol oxidase subunit 2